MEQFSNFAQTCLHSTIRYWRWDLRATILQDIAKLFTKYVLEFTIHELLVMSRTKAQWLNIFNLIESSRHCLRSRKYLIKYISKDDVVSHLQMSCSLAVVWPPSWSSNGYCIGGCGSLNFNPYYTWCKLQVFTIILETLMWWITLIRD